MSFPAHWPAVGIWIVLLLLIGYMSLRYLSRGETTLLDALTGSLPDVDDKPPGVLMLFGLIFGSAGIFVWMSDLQHPTKGSPTTPLEQFVFGAIFFFLGSGLFLMGATAGLIRLVLRRQLAEIDDQIAMRPDSADLHLQRAAMLTGRGRTWKRSTR